MADFMGLMKQAAQLQSKMQELQAELDRIEVEGTAGGGMVTREAHRQGRAQGRQDRRFADASRRKRKSSRTCWSPRMPTRGARPKP